MIELHNCDCTNYIKELPEKSIIVTDPPFNIGYKYNTYKDNKTEDDYYNWIVEIIRNRPSVVIHYPESLYKMAIKMNTPPIKVVSWVYNSNTRKQHRDIAFFNVSPDFSKGSQPYKNPNDKRIAKRIAEGKTARLYDWWNINQIKNVQKKEINHPCVMPLEVMENIIKILPDNYMIVDPFMGSGTTGVAAKNIGRDFIGFEIDKEYFEIAKERICGTTKQF